MAEFMDDDEDVEEGDNFHQGDHCKKQRLWTVSITERNENGQNNR